MIARAVQPRAPAERAARQGGPVERAGPGASKLEPLWGAWGGRRQGTRACSASGAGH